MEKIIQEIEAEFAPTLAQAQSDLEVAQNALNILQEQKKQKLEAAINYYKALENKAVAETIIASTDARIKDKFISAKIDVIA